MNFREVITKPLTFCDETGNNLSIGGYPCRGRMKISVRGGTNMNIIYENATVHSSSTVIFYHHPPNFLKLKFTE